jgi:hypothetical protein
MSLSATEKTPETQPSAQRSPQRPRWLRIALLLAGYAAIIVFGHFAGRWLDQALNIDGMTANSSTANWLLIGGLLVFIVCLALPFVPGIEISLALFALFGTSVALPVYAATLVALAISYTAGRYVPLNSLAVFFDFIGLHAASALVRRLGAMTPRERNSTLADMAPGRYSAFLVRYPELALIAALNVPGNALFGGGGGIALFAGMSGLFAPWRYMLAIAIGSIPVPLLMLFAGHWMR